jgi:hypothetical protein
MTSFIRLTSAPGGRSAQIAAIHGRSANGSNRPQARYPISGSGPFTSAPSRSIDRCAAQAFLVLSACRVSRHVRNPEDRGDPGHGRSSAIPARQARTRGDGASGSADPAVDEKLDLEVADMNVLLRSNSKHGVNAQQDLPCRLLHFGARSRRVCHG